MKDMWLFVADSIQNQTKKATDGAGTGDTLQSGASNLINAAIFTVGFVAVIVIILGGISYATSQGDAAKVKKGKDTILYGVIGLVIAVLAFAIVNFVLNNI